MTLAIDDEHVQISDVLGRALTGSDARGSARASLDADVPSLPAFWAPFADMGWLGLHLPEEFGGSGAGILEACLLMEAVGEHCAPGPFLPVVLSSAVLAASTAEDRRRDLLPGLASGEIIAATGLAVGLSATDGTLSGDAGLVLGAGLADWLLLRVADDLVIVDRTREGVEVSNITSIDRGCPVARVRCERVTYDSTEVLVGGFARALAFGRVFAAAQAAGGARAVTQMGTDYAQVRRQFGRTIGSFQAVKHLCADMLVLTETATAVAWDAARVMTSELTAEADLSAATAACIALPAFMQCAEINVQVHGGIGFTWEHDAHLYLRRAAVLAAVFEADAAATDVWALASRGSNAIARFRCLRRRRLSGRKCARL